MKIKSYLTMPLIALGLVMSIQSCKKDDNTPEEMTTPSTPMMSSTFAYEFNNGQVVPTAIYDGTHMDNLTATMKVDEVTSTTSKITVALTNTVSGGTYHVHAHDAADPSTTPNGTPYNESPNTGVFTQMGTGNGGDLTLTQSVNMSYSDLLNVYNGFFVVHDPLQAVSTVDISTYVVVGTFARTQGASGLAKSTFAYDFNTGQVASAYAYSGTHANNLMGDLKIQELADGTSRVSVMLKNTINAEVYHTHAHDAADPSTTPNGTPYDETPNSGLLTFMITGNGGTAGNSQMSTMSHADITTNYSGFFVVHDPLQAISTVDPTTYVLLGSFAQ